MLIFLEIIITITFAYSLKTNVYGYHFNLTFSDANTLSPDDQIRVIWWETVGNKTYIKDIYDCTNFSVDFVIALRSMGYNSSVLDGWYQDNHKKNRHNWVEIENRYFEPTYGYNWTGMFVPRDVIKFYKKGKIWF
jgi:hypothetical protein